jgi:parallel beta-helix repeat protein
MNANFLLSMLCSVAAIVIAVVAIRKIDASTKKIEFKFKSAFDEFYKIQNAIIYLDKYVNQSLANKNSDPLQQQIEVIEKITTIESQFDELMLSLMAGQIPVKLTKAVKVEGAKFQTPRPILKLSDTKFIEVYHQSPVILQAYAISVDWTADSYQNPQKQPLLLEERANSNYWVIPVIVNGNTNYWLVPNPLRQLRLDRLDRLQYLFTYPTDRELNKDTEYCLIELGKVSFYLESNLDQWRVDKPGKLSTIDESILNESPIKSILALKQVINNLHQQLEKQQVIIQKLEAKIDLAPCDRTQTSLTAIVSLNGDDNSYFSIQDAIDQSPPGTRILVKPGQYQESVVINKQVEIIGDGERSQIILIGSSAAAIRMATSQAKIQNLSLDCLENCKDYTIDIPEGCLIVENCDITSQSLACIGIYNPATQPVIYNCRIHHSQFAGIAVYKNAVGRIEFCDIYANAKPGIAIKEGANPTVINCQIHDGQSAGIYIDKYGTGNIENCAIFRNNLAGIEVKNNSSSIVRNSLIYQGNSTGISVYKQGHAQIEFCDIFGNSKHGILIKESGSAELVNCQIHHGKSNGIYVYKQGRGTIEHCKIYQNEKENIKIEDNCNVNISNCEYSP